MKQVDTYWVKILAGLRQGYDGPISSVTHPANIISEYCDEEGLCVTLTHTTFIYTGGREPGIIVGLINYPRFPRKQSEIYDIAMTLAKNCSKN